MNSIVAMNNGQAVTTSLAIADGTGSQHKNVLELVRTYWADLEEFGRVAFETRPFETAGGQQNREVAVLNEQHASLLLTYMRNSDIVRKFKKALVKAFFELTQRAQPPAAIPQSLSEALRLAADLADQKDQMQAQLAIVAPKAQALDRISGTAGSVCPTDAAKNLQVRPRVLFHWLQEHRWLYRRVGCPHYCGYQDKIQAGLLEQKITVVSRADGTEKSVEQVRITPKGLARLAEMPDFREAA
ncbi:phage regulatory protein/antirepressor Ant [Verminephrobacter aporrectodeae subsp. tuberculatae]|uniref:Phage regulatory protein/antirepressor Ant n=1 Tax=Verminephrobacter aporrectodeae subsp. tuberculatae TaxID=1110392 RepID=A0ABT3KMW4_9BURK|nr:phage regulatory protein/antirepressor Ant [Verminephrobacter aporrectodeae]MCW5319665.1 phage regulatory protein/antirepressor Ant [Verminephrobacter aporrectodeae subsp. tuberculatae]